MGAEKGYYKVSSDPTGGSVFLDGAYYGLSPYTITVYTTATPGHTISVQKSGYMTWSQFYSGNPANGQTISVFATLYPVSETGNIYVNSNPAGASAVLDNGYAQLTTPGTFSSVSTGWHNVQVSKSGYLVYSTDIEVKPGGTSNVMATLVPNTQYGSISVSSNPTGASLYVDTIYQGITNQVVSNLAVGSHTVTLKKSGYQDYSQTATVNNAQTTYLSITLSPLASQPPVILTSPPHHPVHQSISMVLIKEKHARPAPLHHRTGPRILFNGPEKIRLPGLFNNCDDRSRNDNTGDGCSPASSTPATTASAEIYSQPSGADVYINNAYKGVTPLSFENVPIDATKTYSIELRLAGYKAYTDSGSISPGRM